MTPFRSIDIHVHTPASACYVDRMYPELRRRTTAEDIVLAALKAGLEAIVLTDHNSAEFVDAVRSAAGGNGLCVFPGVEITAQGGHLLAIFERDTPVQLLRRLVAELGIAENTLGDGFYGTHLWMDDVFLRIEERGGLAIAAHIDRDPRGFIAGPDPRSVKQRIYLSEHLSGLEITDRRSKLRWNQGTMYHYPQARACVQGSDAHAPEEVGRRPVYLQVERWDLAALRLALADYEQRIRFPHELAPGASGQA